MKNWFAKKIVYDTPQRTLGVLLRIFGIDVSVMGLGWINDWRLIDLRIPVNYGIYLQLWCAVFAIGRLPTSTYDEEVTNG